MSGKVIEFTKTQKYRFDFWTDDKLYSITFNGKIPQGEVRKMLASVRQNSYANMAGAIETYLERRHLEYSNPVSIEVPLKKGDAMGWAGHLLHSDTYKKLDENLGNTDIYHGVMDCQENTQTYSEGCYFAVQKAAWGNGEPQHNAIVQTYFCDKETCDGHGFFAIRKSKGNVLYTIDSSEGGPVLPASGCVDMMALLLDIEAIKSKEDAVRAAVR